MFKKINKDAITEAIHSEEAMVKEIKECHQYRKAYGFCMVAMALPLFLILFYGIGQDHTVPLFLFFGFFLAAMEATANNSRLELFEAISELKRLSKSKEEAP